MNRLGKNKQAGFRVVPSSGLAEGWSQDGIWMGFIWIQNWLHMKIWIFTVDELMMSFWWADDVLVMNWWWIGDEQNGLNQFGTTKPKCWMGWDGMGYPWTDWPLDHLTVIKIWTVPLILQFNICWQYAISFSAKFPMLKFSPGPSTLAPPPCPVGFSKSD